MLFAEKGLQDFTVWQVFVCIMSMHGLQYAIARGVQPAPWDMPLGGVQCFKGQE